MVKLKAPLENQGAFLTAFDRGPFCLPEIRLTVNGQNVKMLYKPNLASDTKPDNTTYVVFLLN
jgi:hypothetical protein